jgi:DNA modification methylase
MISETTHQLLRQDARRLEGVQDESVHLVVTSPPYPMIEMWDDCFRSQSDAAGAALDVLNGQAAFEAMHQVLDPVWSELFRVLVPGGFACVNIGDAARTIGGDFSLYSNHARILNFCVGLGFLNLPAVIWRKQTNAPNKFMGSGMLPAGAYVTLEHEWVLILRKGGKRVFSSAADKARRGESAFFWEERNQWFSDVWFDLKGARQAMGPNKERERSGAFPFELAWRLIHMYSLQGDLVLDPFAGTGTTMAAAACAGRNSLGIERDASLCESARARMNQDLPSVGQEAARERLRRHWNFIADRTGSHGADAFKHKHDSGAFEVVTRLEKSLIVPVPTAVEETGPDSWRALLREADFLADS